MARRNPVGTELLDVARDIAITAGVLAKTRRLEGATVAASKTSLTDIVTFADREVETLIRTLLRAARPNDGFCGEESGEDAGTSGLTWLVDPIDGTVNYLYGIPQYAVSVAVVEGEPDPSTWRALAGCVVNPVSGEIYTATTGGGAFLNEVPIRVAESVDLAQALVGTGFSYKKENRIKQAALIGDLLGQVRDIRRIGSAALDLCNVANGRFNAYFERGLNPWDHAAAGLIAREAGAAVGGLRGAAATNDFILAAEPELFRILEAKLIELGA
jgi:myo-inositol-1(or 4)-monophosphatase